MIVECQLDSVIQSGLPSHRADHVVIASDLVTFLNGSSDKSVLWQAVASIRNAFGGEGMWIIEAETLCADSCSELCPNAHHEPVKQVSIREVS